LNEDFKEKIKPEIKLRNEKQNPFVPNQLKSKRANIPTLD